MKTFNNSDLFTGYLKQLLHTFHLPKLKVYTARHARYLETHGTESPEILGTVEATPTTVPDANVISGALPVRPNLNVRYFPYIKDGEIQEYVNGKWQNIKENEIKVLSTFKYVYGEKILNYTKNLKINSNTYDSYTHEYLGDYLRFQRDFLGLDLMSLYNCFSNRACEKLKYTWMLEAADDAVKVSFDTSDPNFKIYMLPVKLFQRYTIAIDSAVPIEMCCGIYGDYQDKRSKFKLIPQYTYKRVASSTFSQPFIYEALAYSDNKKNTFIDQFLQNGEAATNSLIELAQNESDLKLFLKVPVHNTSTVVVLEGDYRTWNSSIWDMNGNNFDPADDSALAQIIWEQQKKKDNTDAFKLNGYIWTWDASNEELVQSIPDAAHTEAKQLEAQRAAIRANQLKKQFNKSIINLEYKYTDSEQLKLISPLQLLQFNTNEQHPFADRLIEYLIGNAITNAEYEISDNVKRAQKALMSNYNATSYTRKLPGLWNDEMRVLFYEYMMANSATTKFNINHDILGYVDKDVEKFYQSPVKTNSRDPKKATISLSNIELEEGDK